MSIPAFLLATDLRPGGDAWVSTLAQASALEVSLSPIIGFTPRVELAWLPERDSEDPTDHHLGRVIDCVAAEGAAEVFVLPKPFELNLGQRVLLGEEVVMARRRHASLSIHHDTVDPCHPLLIDCLSGQLLRALADHALTPGQAGLLLVADGQGHPATRADTYRLMRLLWEQTGLAQAEVGFLRHNRPFLRDALARCLRDPLVWLVLRQSQWAGEQDEHARLILADHQRAHPEAAGWQVIDPPGSHPAIFAWLEQRMRRLWEEKRAHQAVRVRSRKQEEPSVAAEVWSGERWVAPSAVTFEPRDGLLARVRTASGLSEILSLLLPPAERYLVKVTWHGYATGTYTDPAALDLLLDALPGKAILLEGHTSGRNLGGADWDWEQDVRPRRAWIRQQEMEYLRRTGLADVIARHDAQYLNVTEAWWDGECAPEEEVRAALDGVGLRHTELAGFVPASLMALRGLPMLSFPRFKGPTRLGSANLFGLIPHPVRTPWHGTNLTHFASVCCDLARLYGALFRLFGLAEAFHSAVRWNRQGIYRSRWGNYDLVLTDGIFTVSEGLVGADILASRLQGQDVERSGFYDVVRDRLGWSRAAETPLPADLQAILC